MTRPNIPRVLSTEGLTRHAEIQQHCKRNELRKNAHKHASIMTCRAVACSTLKKKIGLIKGEAQYHYLESFISSQTKHNIGNTSFRIILQ